MARILSSDTMEGQSQSVSGDYQPITNSLPPEQISTLALLPTLPVRKPGDVHQRQQGEYSITLLSVPESEDLLWLFDLRANTPNAAAPMVPVKYEISTTY